MKNIYTFVSENIMKQRQVVRYGAVGALGNLIGYGARKYIKSAAKYAAKRSYTKTRDSKSKVQDSVVTTQYDTKMQYRRKRMPKFKRRQWKNFVKKVSAVSLRGIGIRTVLFNENVVVAPVLGANEQTFAVVHLYGANGVNTVNEFGARDLRQIFVNDTAAETGTKWCFFNGVIDITMTNVDEFNTLEIDVYKIMYGRSDNPTANLSGPLTNVIYETDPIAGGNTQISISRRGATPFDLSDIAMLTKWRVMTKRKYILSPGQIATYQHRDNRNKWMTSYDLDPNSSRGTTDFTCKYTTTFLVVAKANNPNATTANFRLAATRNYRYKIHAQNVNEPKCAVLAG